MTARGRGLATVTRGARPDYPYVTKTSPLWQLEQITRQHYKGVVEVPAGAPIFDWRVCGCDYATPLVDGRPVRQAEDPMYEWSEETAQGRHSLAREVRRLAALYGCGYFHAKDAFRSNPGYPDAHIWHPGLWTAGRHVGASGGRLVRELKPPGKIQFYGPQLATMTTMRLEGADVGTWSSCCLLSGRISAELRTIAGATEPLSEDVYGCRTPGGRPADSGPAYLPGDIAPPPDDATAQGHPMSEGPPTGASRPATPRGGRPPAGGVALLAELAADTVDGYAANPSSPGLDVRAAATAVKQLVGWATDHNVANRWPWRMVVTGARYYVLDQAGGWTEVSRLAGGADVVALLEPLKPRRVSASSVAQCQAMLTGGAR